MDGAKVGSLDDVPVNIVLDALQKQVKELQSIAAAAPQPVAQPSSTNDTDNEQVALLKQRIKELEIQNAKAEYRIQILLRTLEQRDKLLNNNSQ